MDRQYHALLRRVLDQGAAKEDRTGTGTLSVFGHQMRFDLGDGFPLQTTKRVHFLSVVAELVWMLRGSTNVHDLRALGATIWDEWAGEGGELGPVYGVQWRSWCTYDGFDVGYADQIAQVLATLRADPDSRRMVVSAWNVADLPRMALAPCHCLFQFYTRPLSLRQRLAAVPGRVRSWDWAAADGYRRTALLDEVGAPSRYLDCHLYQRSADCFLGLPFNVASYALLTHLVARTVGMAPGHLVHSLGDAHLYSNHLEQAREVLGREPRPPPRLVLDPDLRDLLHACPEQVALEGYDPHPAVRAEVAV